MHAVLALVLGLWLALGSPARAAPQAWSVEVDAGFGRLILVWPQPTPVTLTQAGTIAHLRAGRTLAAPPPSATTALASWLLHAAAAPDGDLALQLRPGIDARLAQPHPRLTVIEFRRVTAPVVPVPSPPDPFAVEWQAAMVTPAAGPAPTMPVPRSRPTWVNVAAAPVAAAPTAVEGADDAKPPNETALPEPKVTVVATVAPNALEVRFRWGSPVPAAMFERGGQFWVVFPDADAPVAGWRSLARPEVASWLEPIATATAGDARLFRFRLVRPVRIEPGRSEDGWTVQLTAGDAAPVGSGTSPWLRDPDRGELAVAADGVVAQVRDPESGERLTLLLTAEDGLRHPTSARLVDLELLPSLQGLVWRPLTDGVIATVADGQLSVTRPGGLRLSTVAAHDLAPPDPAMEDRAGQEPRPPAIVKPPADDHAHVPEPVAPASHAAATPSRAAASGALELAGLSALGATGRQQARTRLLGELRGLAGPQRAQARLDLARLYLADALGPEARTALELIDDRELSAPAAAPLRTARLALTGAAEALAGRPDPALASLLDHALDEDGEIALWRAYAAALGARWPLATQEWQRSGGLPPAYPDPLRRRLGLELAAALVDHGDASEARALLRQLTGFGLAGADGGRLRLLEGIADLREGRPQQAEGALAAAVATGEGDVAARARFLLVSARADAGSLTARAAAAALDGQRRHWRGQSWEPRMLARLAELQAVAGRPVEAIATWREAVARTADPADAAAAGDALRRQVAGMLADETTPPMARLAMHRAHGTLLEGADGADGIRATLGAAAARAGLTDTAAALLDAAAPGTQVAAGHAALAAALAGRGELDAARQRLARATPGSRTDDLDRELRARAALAAGDPAQAAAALQGVGSVSGRALEREIQAGQGGWAELARLTGAELAAADADGDLDPSQAAATVWLGLAQMRLGRTDAATGVGARYAARIADPQLATLLRLATLAAPGLDDDGPGAGQFAATLRRDPATLPASPAGDAGSGLRTASARSGPTG